MPIDDEHTLSVGWFYERVPNELTPFEQGEIPYWYSPIKDPETGRWITTHIMNQDFVAWVGQGAKADRTQERLGESDRGIIMMRQRLQEQARVVADGGVPKATLAAEQEGERVTLPIIGRKHLVDGYTLEELEQGAIPAALGPREFAFQYGQPPEIRHAYRAAMGLDRGEG